MGQRVRTSEKILCTRGNNIVAFSCYVRILEYFTDININIAISRHHQRRKTKQICFFKSKYVSAKQLRILHTFIIILCKICLHIQLHNAQAVSSKLPTFPS